MYSSYQTLSFQILGVHYQMPDMEFATTYTWAPSTSYLVPGTSYQVPRTRYLALPAIFSKPISNIKQSRCPGLQVNLPVNKNCQIKKDWPGSQLWGAIEGSAWCTAPLSTVQSSTIPSLPSTEQHWLVSLQCRVALGGQPVDTPPSQLARPLI